MERILNGQLNPTLCDGFKHFWFSPLPGEIIQFDEYSDALKPPTSTQLKKWRSDMAGVILSVQRVVWGQVEIHEKDSADCSPSRKTWFLSTTYHTYFGPLARQHPQWSCFWNTGPSPDWRLTPRKIRKRHLFELNKYVIQLRCLQLMM